MPSNSHEIFTTGDGPMDDGGPCGFVLTLSSGKLTNRRLKKSIFPAKYHLKMWLGFSSCNDLLV